MATFSDMQDKNRMRTKVIVVCFVLFFIWLGLGLDLTLYFWSGGTTQVVERYRYNYNYSTYPSTLSGMTIPARQHKQFQPIFTLIVGLAGVGLAWWSMSNAAE